MKKKATASTKAAGLHAHAGTSDATTKKRRRSVVDAETIVNTKDKGLSNVIYIGHIPHGFYEKQMKEFFSQFGQVSHVRLSRNKKTGKSKHYGFIQFMSAEVAEIVADAMNGYHFFGQKLEVKVMNKADVHPEIFKGANRTFKRIPWREIESKRHNKERTEEEEAKRKKRASQAARKRAKKIAAAGIEYSYGDIVPVDDEKSTSKTKKKKKPVVGVVEEEKVAGEEEKKTATTKKKPSGKDKAAKELTPRLTRSRAKAQKKR